MRVFPPEDALELVERHAAIDLPVLGRRAGTSRTSAAHCASRQRRQRADDRLPLGDRQARVREPGDAADDDHREHQRAAQRAARPRSRGRRRRERRAIGDDAGGRGAKRWPCAHFPMRRSTPSRASGRMPRMNALPLASSRRSRSTAMPALAQVTVSGRVGPRHRRRTEEHRRVHAARGARPTRRSSVSTSAAARIRRAARNATATAA